MPRTSTAVPYPNQEEKLRAYSEEGIPFQRCLDGTGKCTKMFRCVLLEIFYQTSPLIMYKTFVQNSARKHLDLSSTISKQNNSDIDEVYEEVSQC